ncbi:ribonuclease H-like domain-containing protein [Tanacetum coccineum]
MIDEFQQYLVGYFSIQATKDETSEILCNLIIGLENQLNHNVKIIRCDNGTEFKNHAMNEFCAKKGIKREFSVARTPQQNGVAERKNMTLIEATRTMLADSLLPIPFWAEAINTVSYVLHMVLVTKPQNKTPYELLIDSLGKFDGKSDEGYFLGYSTTSKAFRVYNKRTKRVEENLHIDFLEDQPNVAGTDPNWMFDLDFLTNSMNYIPVSVENHVNVDAVEYVAPVAHEKPYESSPKDNDVQDSEDVADKEGQHQMTEDGQVLHDELEKMIAQEVREAQTTSINKLSTGRSSVSTATTSYVSVASTPTGDNAGESSFVYLGGKIPIDASTLPNADLPIDPNMPNLEGDSDAFLSDGIFNGAYDNENVGAVVDFNNMDDTINVSPIPILRIHKNHPKELILGDLKSAVQTRGKIQKVSSAQQALVSYISKQNRTNHKNHHTCLLACFLSQEEPKNISQALQDESWVKAMQEELLQFKLQKVWILVDLSSGKKAIGTKWEEGIDYDEVFAPIARIKAIRLFLAFASYMGFTVYQMDVKSAFLYGTIEEEVYVHQPPGFVDPAHPNKVYKKSMCTEFEDCMHKRFLMSSMGELTFFLGLQVKQQPDGIFISQDKDSPFELEAFSDSDYGRASLDRKSTTGGCQFLGRRLISCQCKKQTIMANSTTEAEYVAAANCCGKVLWIQNQMMDYGFNFMNTKIHIDNESTISVIKNPIAHSRTKHIEIRFHFIRDCYEKRLIEVIKIHTDSNVADLLTKGFDVTRFHFLVVSIGMLNL